VGRIVRDVAVAVAAGFIVAIVAAFTTSLSRIQLVGVFAGGLAACALLLGALEAPGAIRRRRDAFKAEVVAAAKDAVLAELDSRAPQAQQGASPGAILRAASAPGRADDLAALSNLLENGRVLQARLGEPGTLNAEVPNDLAVEIARWEAQGATALTRKPDLLDEYRRVPYQNVFTATMGSMNLRMEHQLGVLEEAVQEILGRGDSREDL
jgi:hypothetical protein